MFMIDIILSVTSHTKEQNKCLDCNLTRPLLPRTKS